MGKHIKPIEVCERLIGPAPAISAACGLNRTAAYLWFRPSKGRFAGDIPGAPNMRALLDYSDKHDLGLTAEHLIRGATEDEIASILVARGAGKVAAE